ENTGRDVERFGAARAHRLLHPDRHPANDELHHAEIVKNREERGDEDDDRQDLKREYHAEGPALDSQRSEQELAADLGITEHGIYTHADLLKQLAEICPQHQDRERELQTESPQQDSQPYGVAMAGEKIRYGENDDQSQ